jgi:hypothetical protein
MVFFVAGRKRPVQLWPLRLPRLPLAPHSPLKQFALLHAIAVLGVVW